MPSKVVPRHHYTPEQLAKLQAAVAEFGANPPQSVDAALAKDFGLPEHKVHVCSQRPFLAFRGRV
jgi:hypothetical protein